MAILFAVSQIGAVHDASQNYTGRKLIDPNAAFGYENLVALTYYRISQIVVVCASILITVGLYDQSLKVWRTKSAKDFTVSIIIAILVNEVAWFNYGFSIKEWPVLLVSLLNIPAAVLVAVGYFKFRR